MYHSTRKILGEFRPDATTGVIAGAILIIVILTLTLILIIMLTIRKHFLYKVATNLFISYKLNIYWILLFNTSLEVEPKIFKEYQKTGREETDLNETKS